jgi:hypothetical protein
MLRSANAVRTPCSTCEPRRDARAGHAQTFRSPLEGELSGAANAKRSMRRTEGARRRGAGAENPHREPRKSAGPTAPSRGAVAEFASDFWPPVLVLWAYAPAFFLPSWCCYSTR